MDETTLITRAQEGEARALDALLRGQQDRVHRLAVRILADPEAARDATQEILIRVMTNLGSFQGAARFDTWVYRVAMNYLLTARKIRARMPQLSFDGFAADLAEGLSDPEAAAPEDHVMLGELRLRCTMAMLLCLKPEARAAYVLGEVFEMDHGEASEVLAIAPALYRKRLSRARAAVEAFTARACGLVSEAAPCRCPRRMAAAQACGRLGTSPRLPGAPDYSEILALARRTEAALVSAKLQRSAGPLAAPEGLTDELMTLIAPPGG